MWALTDAEEGSMFSRVGMCVALVGLLAGPGAGGCGKDQNPGRSKDPMTRPKPESPEPEPPKPESPKPESPEPPKPEPPVPTMARSVTLVPVPAGVNPRLRRDEKPRPIAAPLKLVPRRASLPMGRLKAPRRKASFPLTFGVSGGGTSLTSGASRTGPTAYSMPSPLPGGMLPKPISVPKMKYPTEARRKGLEGAVVLSVLVKANGRVGAVKVVRSAHKLLDQAAVRALKQARFKPATNKAGKAVSFRIPRYRYVFRLADHQ